MSRTMTCRAIKYLIGDYKIYLGHNVYNGQPETRIDLNGYTKTVRERIRKVLKKHGFIMWRDAPLDLGLDYIICRAE